jgi:ring-1,2-phenylacetyl-CoA epoxidase subunit PaaD
MSDVKTFSKDEIWEALKKVSDPEIPVLSVVDLGIITKVEESDKGIEITMTPTFVGCPAIDVMKKDIKEAAEALDMGEVTVHVDFETQWSSNRMTEEGRKALEGFGLAPPPHLDKEMELEDLDRVRCPHCGSTDTTLRSTFGSTLCRAIRFCFNCKQSFEQFKPVD